MSKRPLWLIKIGTNVLSDSRGRLERRVLSGLVGQICRHGLPKYDIALVSSGAIGAGIGQLGLEARPDDIVMRQVCASVGQGVLMKHYHDLFARYGRHVAQILVTHDTLHEPVSIRNMKNMMRRLPQLGVVPVINENDAIATTEIGRHFGDNDMLSAGLAAATGARKLVMLTDVDGVFASGAVVARLERHAKPSALDRRKSSLGVGGMKSKIEAGRLCAESGISTVIANGRGKNVLLRLFMDESAGTEIL